MCEHGSQGAISSPWITAVGSAAFCSSDAHKLHAMRKGHWESHQHYQQGHQEGHQQGHMLGCCLKPYGGPQHLLL